MTWSMGVALVVTIGAIAALIKRCETRLVLLSAGILMALLSLEPMTAFKPYRSRIGTLCINAAYPPRGVPQSAPVMD